MRLARLISCGLVIASLAGCSKDVKKSGSKNADGKPGGEGPQAAAYDPAKDPLVNPPSLTEPIPADKPDAVQENEILVRTLDGNPSSLNPIFSSSVYESHMSELLFDGLFSFDKDLKWFVNKEVVDSFEESPDHLVNTVKLKPGLKWHDGAPWTAHDVEFSFKEIMDDRVAVPAVRDGTDQIAEVKALDDATVRFTHKKALPTAKWNMSFPIIPEHIYGAAAELAKDPTLLTSDYFNKANREGTVGNGPYKLVSWETNNQIVVERWEDYHGSKPHFKRIILKIIPDKTVSLKLFTKGDLDEMMLSAQQFAMETVNDPAFAQVGVKGYAPAWGFSYIGYNMTGANPFFNDAKVRRAMTHALDIPRIIRDIGYNLVQPCNGIFSPGSWMYNADVKPLAYDLKQAAALLDEAGWAVDRNDGFRYKNVNGERVKFEFELLVPQGSPTSPKVAAIFQQDLKKIGVILNTRIMEWAAFMQVVNKHEFQAEIAGWGSGTDPDTNSNLWTTKAVADGRNYGGYSNPRVDELFALARAEFDEAKRAAYYREIQKLIYDDQPYTFIYERGTTWAFNKRIRGVQFSPREVFGFDPSYKSWWVAKQDSMRAF